MNPDFKYAGEAIILIGIAFRLLRWAYGAVQEGDAPPSGTQVTLSTDAPLRGVAGAFAALTDTPAAEVKTSLFSKKFNVTVPPGGSPALPPELAAQLSPELQAKVLEAIAKVQPGGQPVHVTAKTSFTTHVNTSGINADLFPPEMLAAMTPEQRAKVMETLAKGQNGTG